jgi:hypothetical protein
VTDIAVAVGTEFEVDIDSEADIEVEPEPVIGSGLVVGPVPSVCSNYLVRNEPPKLIRP